MQRPGQDPVAKDDAPWWMKYAGRGLGTVGSISEFIITYVMCDIPFYIIYPFSSPSFFYALRLTISYCMCMLRAYERYCLNIRYKYLEINIFHA